MWIIGRERSYADVYIPSRAANVSWDGRVWSLVLVHSSSHIISCLNGLAAQTTTVLSHSSALAARLWWWPLDMSCLYLQAWFVWNLIWRSCSELQSYGRLRGWEWGYIKCTKQTRGDGVKAIHLPISLMVNPLTMLRVLSGAFFHE